jgi:hypothetical protein
LSGRIQRDILEVIEYKIDRLNHALSRGTALRKVSLPDTKRHVWRLLEGSRSERGGAARPKPAWRFVFCKTRAITLMAKIINEKFVEASTLKHLKKKGWDYNIKVKGLHEHGCDIVVTDSRNKNKARRFYIECKGKSYAKSARAIADTNFLFALGQLVTRMTVIARHAYKYGLALPEESAKKAVRRIPWQVARHLCLYVFSVDDRGIVTEYSPKDFKRMSLAEKSRKDLLKPRQNGLSITRPFARL